MTDDSFSFQPSQPENPDFSYYNITIYINIYISIYIGI